MRRVRRVLPIALAGIASFSLVCWWPAARPKTEVTPSPAATPVPAIGTAAVPATPVPAKETDRKDQRVWERFTSQFKVKDPFGSAGRLLREIDAMTAEDFRKLLEEKNWPSANSYGFDKEFANAFADALVERWLALDGDKAAPAMFELSEGMKHGSYSLAGADDMLGALARVRPELFLAEVVKEEKPAPSLNLTMQAAFRSLAARDVAEARRWLDRLPRPDQRKSAEIAIGTGVAQSDPIAAVALARGSGNDYIFRTALTSAAKIGPGILGQVLEANDGKFSADALTPLLMFQYPDLPWDRLSPRELNGPRGIEINVLDEASRLAPEDRERILTQLHRLPQECREEAAGAILKAWVADDPKAAIEWMTAHTEPSSRLTSDSMRGVFGTWMRADQNAALVWFNALPSSDLRDRLSNDAAIPLAASGDLERAMELFRPIPGKDGEPDLIRMASAQAKSDPERAAAWCESLPTDINPCGATQSIVTAWFSKDSAAAANWVEALPEGKQRDVGFWAYAQAALTLDAEAAGAWAAGIKDSPTRTRVAHQVFNAMLEADPAAAIKWVRQFPGLDERVRETILRARAP